mmetsp:Transcript_103001/g.300515  ORF Transcript_103001/g.300515 Transcript_103001/m.300515 type:complete len:310 (-) Transcript_103001:258-1187(-)
MFRAMLQTYKANTNVDSVVPLDLAGEWLPVRHSEWYNRLPGKHSQRARSSSTKMTYDCHGKGSGWVGEVFVNVQAHPLAPGQYSAKFQVRTSLKTAPWSASDGRLTLLEDGTLQVQYPSYGIREYWRRANGCGAQPRAAHEDSSDESSPDEATTKNQRKIKMVFRHFGSAEIGLLWHWGLSIEDSIYEVNGAMAVMGPKGVVAASSPFMKPVCTNLLQFDGYLDLSQTTHKSDEEIEEFSRRWVKLHPRFSALGPNCQTYSEDLFAFLTGDNLPFARFADKVVGPRGNTLMSPERDPNTVWLDSSKKPR